MEKVIEALLELIPFAGWLEGMGFSKTKAVGLSVVFVALLVWGIKALLVFLSSHYKNSKAARDMAPYFPIEKVKEARKYYIPTQSQNVSPTREEEPGVDKHVIKSPLISHFLHIFEEKEGGDKFHLVLADSGMGKTTFMINLFVKYHSFFNFKRKYKMKIFPFGDKRIIEKIKEIKPEDAKNTILLLDAFDEDKALLKTDEDLLSDEQRFRKRMDEIVDAVRDFREIIITSRTQYFPGTNEPFYELKIPKFYGKGFHKMGIMYLSPFDSKEIRRFLNKKYGIIQFWNWKKKKRATEIVQNSPRLMVRPMLLSYINLLVDSKKSFSTTYEIYETLIEKWLEREADKRKQSSKRVAFMENLYRYSHFVALKIYEDRKESNMLFLDKATALQVAQVNNIDDLDEYEITGQSLLTRDAENNWKFAHKSILEFFIAKEAIENPTFAKNIDYSGMDMAKMFYCEVKPCADMIFVKGSSFMMGSNRDEKYEKPAHNVNVPDFYIGKYQVTVGEFKMFIEASKYQTDADREGYSKAWNGKKWTDIDGANWECDTKGNKRLISELNHPVIHVSWNDANAYAQWMAEQTGISYRLPSEAEWEFAARGGNESKKYQYSGGDDLGKVGWYSKNSGKTTHPVGDLDPNELGIYDMSGNVWEWCLDKWHDDYTDAPDDGTAWVDGDGSGRMIRGGSWSNTASYCRVSYRNSHSPDYRSINIGFRLAYSSS